MEIWKPVKNFENLYEISNIGRLKSLPRPRRYKDINTGLYKTYMTKEYIIKGRINDNGYKRTILSKNGTRFYMDIHRLVAEVFIPNPENKPCVNHKNGRKLDNRVNNLEWTTYKENNNHAQNTGLWKTVTFNKKPILNITTGKQYESAIAAAKDIHKEVPTSNVETVMKNIKACCYGKQKSAYKYQWKHL